MKSIQFTGVPGSGKSSVYIKLRDIFKDDKKIICGIDQVLYEKILPVDKLYKSLDKISPYFLKKKLRASYFHSSHFPNEFIKYVESNPHLLIEAIHSIRWNGPIFENQQITTWLKPHIIHAIAKKYLNNDEYFFVDEGPVQRTTTFYAEYDESDIQTKLEEYESYVQDVVLLVHFDVSNDECIKRLNSRTTGLPKRLVKANQSQIYQYLDSSRRIIKRMCNYCESKGARIISMDTTELSLDFVVRKIAEHINDIAK